MAPVDLRLARANFFCHAVLSAFLVSLLISWGINGYDLPPVTPVLGLLLIAVTLHSWRAYDRLED